MPAPPRVLGTIHLEKVEMPVLISALEFLRGEPLSIILPGTKTKLTVGQKIVLIQYIHLAHALSIQPLQNAAMHALCASILRRPKDWSDTQAVAKLVKEMTTRGNPARRVLFDGPNCLLPGKKDKQLACGVVARGIICMNGRVNAMWTPLTVMPTDDSEDDDSTDLDSDGETEDEGTDSDEYVYSGDDEGTEEDSDR